jgi:hypothetical protein
MKQPARGSIPQHCGLNQFATFFFLRKSSTMEMEAVDSSNVAELILDYTASHPFRLKKKFRC